MWPEPDGMPMTMHVTANIDPARPGIIVIDDDPGVRRSLLMLLKARGFMVRAYGHGAALVSDPAARTARLLIADWKMPGMNGLEILARLRATGWTGSALMLTGYYDARLADKAAATGFACTLAKPLADHVLIETVTTLLARE